MNNEKNTLKIRDLRIYFNIAVIISAAVKKISQKEEINVFLHALALTLGWLCGKLITNYIDEMQEISDENRNT